MRKLITMTNITKSRTFQRTPSFDGFHALSLPEGFCIRTESNLSFVVSPKNIWVVLENSEETFDVSEAVLSYSSTKIKNLSNNQAADTDANSSLLQRKRGRPRKHKVSLKHKNQTNDCQSQPQTHSKYRTFIKVQMQDPDIIENYPNSRDRFKACVEKWNATYKAIKP